MRELLDTLAAWQAEGRRRPGRRRAHLRSAPRPEGAVLLVRRDGRIAGSVSGGCVEGAAAEEVERARATGHARVIRYGISDEQAWDVGLACGGTIDVLVEPAVPAAVGRGGRGVAAPAGMARRSSRRSPPTRRRPTSVRIAPGDGAPPARTGRARRRDARRVARRPDARCGAASRRRPRRSSAGSRGPWSSAAGRCFIEVFPVRPRLVVVGRSRSPARSCASPASSGYETVVIDGRASFATPERFPDVDRLIVGWPDEVADEIGLGPNDAVAVLTHDVKFDEPAIVDALRAGAATSARSVEQDTG